jgi:hypothetical protein
LFLIALREHFADFFLVGQTRHPLEDTIDIERGAAVQIAHIVASVFVCPSEAEEVNAETRTKAEEFLRLAQECRATAQTLSTEQARAEMLAMADVCDRVAAQPTDGTDVSETGVALAECIC